MTSPLRRFALMAAVLLLLVPTFFQKAAADPAPAGGGSGDLWDVTSQMSMEGVPMALPAQKLKVCAPKVWKEPPGAADERRKCRTSDFKMDGAKATWKVTCAGPPEMTGTGEVTRDGSDSYSGEIKFSSSDGAMTVKLTGHRIGACEPPQG